MKSCPNCNLYFNDGYACPQCGGALHDQDAYMQQQAAYSQDAMAYGSYPTAPSYEQPYPQQQAYGYAAGLHPQQPYAPQMAAYQPTQAYVSPEPAHTEPAYLDAAPEPAASAASAPLVIEQKGGRGKTVAIVILAVLAVALGAACAFFALNDSSKPKPTELEAAVVNSAWTWQSNVNDALDEMDAAAALLRGSAENAGTTADAAAAEGAEAGATAAAEAGSTAPAEEGGVTPGETSNDMDAPDAPNAAAASEEPIAEDASAATEELTPDEAAAIDEAEGAVTAIEEGDMAGAAETTSALGSEFAQMGESAGDLLGHTVALASLASNEQMQALDAPMQALREDYPDLVSAWDAVRDTVSTYMANSFSDQADTAGTPDSAAASNAVIDAGTTDSADATTEDTTNDAASIQNAEDATGENALATSDAATWETFLEDFRAATATFMQMAADAGFALS